MRSSVSRLDYPLHVVPEAMTEFWIGYNLVNADGKVCVLNKALTKLGDYTAVEHVPEEFKSKYCVPDGYHWEEVLVRIS